MLEKAKMDASLLRGCGDASTPTRRRIPRQRRGLTAPTEQWTLRNDLNIVMTEKKMCVVKLTGGIVYDVVEESCTNTKTPLQFL